MSAFPIVLNDETWRTSEHLFQALRFEKGGEVWQEILECKSPMGAKFIMKKHVEKMLIVPRSPQDLLNMEKVLTLKFDQHLGIRKQLIETDDAQIIEDVTNRQNESGLFWGAAKVHDNWWYGQNILGRMLMDERKKRQYVN